MEISLQQVAIDDGLIDPEYHDQLLADLPAVVRQAGIPEKYVWRSVREFAGKSELAFLRKLQAEDSPIGLMYVGKFDDSINERMMTLAGACLRNYVNAKVMMLYDILQCLKEGDMPSPTVLLIPDFYNGAPLAEWQKSSLLGMLMKREQNNQKTVLYISDPQAMALEYGDAFAKQIANSFVRVTNKEN